MSRVPLNIQTVFLNQFLAQILWLPETKHNVKPSNINTRTQNYVHRLQDIYYFMSTFPTKITVNI